MQITAESRWMPFILIGPNRYATEDKKNTARAITATINRLGPSGSLMKKNSNLEQIMAVAASISSEIFFDLKYRFGVRLSIAVTMSVFTNINILQRMC
jgi:hypothetical protein